MIKIEFPAGDNKAAEVFGLALLQLSGTATVVATLTGRESGKLAAGAATVPAFSTNSTASDAAVPDSPGASSTACDDQFAPDPAADVTPASLILDPDGGSTDGPGVLPELDPKGVAFSVKYCGVSAKPFYEKGKTSGQWKKRRGVDQADYDAWYAGELQPGAAQTTVDTEPLNTAGAFNGQTTETAPAVPTTTGAFMEWVSAKQVAELLEGEDIKAAYSLNGTAMADLFPPHSDQLVAARIANLYATLSAKAGA